MESSHNDIGSKLFQLYARHGIQTCTNVTPHFEAPMECGYFVTRCIPKWPGITHCL